MNSERFSLEQTEDQHFNINAQKRVLTAKKKRSCKRTTGKRFTNDQIKSLESIFKMEKKVEAKKKLQLARELGLQPRQIAIWFQNRRARWKSKQLEEEYIQLKAGFDSLNMQFVSLKKEKQSLLIELERLRNLLSNPNDEPSRRKDEDVEEDKNHTSIEEAIFSSLNDGQELWKFGEYEDTITTSLASPEDDQWRNLDLGGLFNQSCGSSSKWWDF